MKIEFLIPFVIGYFGLWVCFYIFQRINFKNKYIDGFSLRNTFSFETHNFDNGVNLIFRIGFIALTLLGTLPFIVFFASEKITYTIHVDLLIAGCLLMVSMFLKILQYFTKTLNIKLFISEYVFRMLTLIGSMLFTIIGIGATITENYKLYQDNSAILWAFFIIFIIMLLINLSWVFNSKFFKWYQFEKDEEGQIKKPKTIGIALYQWIFDFSEIFLVIFVSVLMYFC